MLEALSIELVGAILYEIGKNGLRWFTESPARKAIDTTAADFPTISTVEASLTKWCKSEDFISQIKLLYAGDNQQADDPLINSFIDMGGFFDGLTTTHVSAQRVLEAFFRHLEEEL